METTGLAGGGGLAVSEFLPTFAVALVSGMVTEQSADSSVLICCGCSRRRRGRG